MAALTSIALGLGVASMGYGMYEKAQGQEQMQQGYAQQQQGALIQAEAARQQAQISKEQAASSVVYAGQERDLNILAAQQSASASAQSATINQSILGEQLKQEGIKRTAMEVDSRRSQLEIIRNQQRARAVALATGTAQGAQRGSGLQGAYGQISGASGTNLVTEQQALYRGRDIFDSNMAITNSNIQMNNLQNLYAQQQAANTTSKSNLTYDYAVTNAGYQTRMADTQTLASQGSGMYQAGSGMVNMGQSISQSGSQFLSMGPQIFQMGAGIQQQYPTFANYFKQYY